MNGMTLYSNTFGSSSFDRGGSVARLNWSESTASMTDEDFKTWLVRFAEQCRDVQSQFVIIDVRNFRHQPDAAAMGSWRDTNVIPLYNAAGVKAFAFLLPEGSNVNNEPTVNTPATYPTGYFTSIEAIEHWFDTFKPNPQD